MSGTSDDAPRQSAQRTAEIAERLGDEYLRSLWPPDLERAAGYFERAGGLHRQAGDRAGEARAARKADDVAHIRQLLADSARTAEVLDGLLALLRAGEHPDLPPPFDRPLDGLVAAGEQLLAARAAGEYLEALTLVPVVVRWHELARRVERAWPLPPPSPAEPRTPESLAAWIGRAGSPWQAETGLLAWVLGAAQQGAGREQSIDALLTGQQRLADGLRQLTEQVMDVADAVGRAGFGGSRAASPSSAPTGAVGRPEPAPQRAAEAPDWASRAPSGSRAELYLPDDDPVAAPPRLPDSDPVVRLAVPRRRPARARAGWPRWATPRVLGIALLLAGAVLGAIWGLGAFPVQSSARPPESATPAAPAATRIAGVAPSPASPTATSVPAPTPTPTEFGPAASPLALSRPTSSPEPAPTATPSPTPAATGTPTPTATSTPVPSATPAAGESATPGPTAVPARASAARDPGGVYVYVKAWQALADGPANQRVGTLQPMQSSGFGVVGRNEGGTALKVQPASPSLIAGWVRAEYVELPAGVDVRALPLVD